jgi:hypothetical protein
MKRVLTVATIALLLVVISMVASAQTGITGKWQGETRNGTPVVLDLKATDATLDGTVTRGDQPAAKIEEGKVTKNTFTFKATLGDQTETLSGELAGEQLTVWLDRQGREMGVVFTRSKS